MIAALVKRNLKTYFRDMGTVFFSMLGVLIIVALYALFLGNLVEDSASYLGTDNARFLIDTWIMGGVVTASSITTTLGAYGIMVNDREKKIVRDFIASPLKNIQLSLSYLISAIIIGVIMSTFTLVIALIYIGIQGNVLSVLSIIMVLGVIVLSVTASSAMIFLLMMFLKSNNAMSAISILVGTLVGFLTGIYVPIGQLPSGIQNVIKIFPPSHAAVLMRQIMMNDAMPLSQIPLDFKLILGVEFEMGGNVLSPWVHLLILLSTSLIFFLLSAMILSRRKEKE